MLYTMVTGACGGLGGAFCEIFAERGEALFLTGRSEERLRALSLSLKQRFPALEVKSCPCDLRSEESRNALFSHADEEGVRFQRLIYVAGVDTQMAAERYDENRIVTQARVNFEGAVSLFRGMLARSPLDGKTEVLAIGSVSGTVPMPYFALYSATKKALEQYCIALRAEMKGRAKVTCVLPGGMPTREDIKENIATHGLFGRISQKSPRSVALLSLKAVKRNRRKKIIGFWNKFLRCFTAITPAFLREKIILRMWKRTEKDHFAEDKETL